MASVRQRSAQGALLKALDIHSPQERRIDEHLRYDLPTRFPIAGKLYFDDCGPSRRLYRQNVGVSVPQLHLRPQDHEAQRTGQRQQMWVLVDEAMQGGFVLERPR